LKSAAEHSGSVLAWSTEITSCPGSHCRPLPDGQNAACGYGPRRRDSRECPGPISEATLHRPSPGRAITAGAIALAAIAPALDPAEHSAEAVQATPVLPEAKAVRAAPEAVPAAPDAVHPAPEAVPAVPAAVHAAPDAVPAAPALREVPERARTSGIRTESVIDQRNVAFANRATTAERASRAKARRTTNVRPVTGRLAALRTVRAAERSAAMLRRAQHVRAVRKAVARRALIRLHRARAAAHRATRPVVRSVTTKHATVRRSQRVVRLGNGMTAVIAYAKSQIGKRYVSGGEGPSGFDCSGFTKRAYARAGLRLPHSSTAQAARARSISRAAARPGDLVVGPGHVGIYMGRGMMIDAGNHRTGVIYRKLYSGLRVERF
jgi:cell wall-associated NlpC family hydrolase